MQTLPLIEYAKTLYPNVSLENVCVIAVQHLLETTFSMFNGWFERGLLPENLYVLGKCYSTNSEVAGKMAEKGIHVSELSSLFHSHLPYDAHFQLCISEFVKHALSQCKGFEKIILIDDGGHLIQRMNLYRKIHSKVVAIEQTSSGIVQLNKISLNFPVINVAKSAVKLLMEPPWVAEVIYQNLKKKISQYDLNPKKVLILGNGMIGKAVKSLMKDHFSIQICDQCLDIRSLKEADLVMGCSGKTSLPVSKHPFLKPHCILVSASSSDREFDAVHFRKKVPSYLESHQDIFTGHVHLFNSGFPLNFNGGLHSVQPEKIQLTRALITSGLFQAASMDVRKNQWVDLLYQEKILKEFQTMNG